MFGVFAHVFVQCGRGVERWINRKQMNSDQYGARGAGREERAREGPKPRREERCAREGGGG